MEFDQSPHTARQCLGRPRTTDLFAAIRTVFPWLHHVFADGAGGSEKLEVALLMLSRWSMEIAEQPLDAKGFEVLSRRWMVERMLACLNRNRRPAMDFEATIVSAEAWIMIASVHLMTRRLASA